MSGAPGRKGFSPVCHTELHRWAVEEGYSSTTLGRVVGIHRVTVRRHFLGWAMDARTSRDYRLHFKGIPVPVRGRPQWFAHPLPIRKLPLPGTIATNNELAR